MSGSTDVAYLTHRTLFPTMTEFFLKHTWKFTRLGQKSISIIYFLDIKSFRVTDHNGIKLGISNEIIRKLKNIWKSSNIQLNKPWIIEGIKNKN